MSGFLSPRGPCRAAGGSETGVALILPCLGVFCSPQGKGNVREHKQGWVLRVGVSDRLGSLVFPYLKQ